MNFFTLSLGIAVLSCSCVFAALPPFYQTLKEYKALLNDPQFEKSFTSADVIESIERSQNSFVITTNKRTVNVEISYAPATHPGPEQFTFTFKTPQEKE